MANYEIEVTRTNVTPAQFLSAVRAACKAKGIEFGIETEDFKNPRQLNDIHYTVIDGKKHVTDAGRSYEWDGSDAACKAETCRTLPLDHQTYVLNWDGSMYNEICEFTHDDDKKGTGYYYQANRDA